MPLLVLVAAMLSATAPAGLGAQTAAEQIEQLLSAYHAQRQFNGAALVAEGGKVLYRGGFGYANMEWEVPNTPNTKFRTGSITKQFTAALMLLLAEDGRVRLDAPVRAYLPEYPQPQGDRITIHHLLAHTSGLPNYTALPEFREEYSRDPMSPEAIVSVTSSLPLEFEPGTRFSYSNSGYVLLGWIIETVTGQSYDRVLQARILEPLGLRDTGYDHEHEVRERGSSGYTRTLEGYENARYLDTSIPHAAGMLYSTVDDLFTWTRALHGDGLFGDPRSRTRMLTPNLEGYGYGIVIRERPVGEYGRTVKVVEHSGGIFGFTSILRHFPDSGHTIALLDNTSGDLGPILDGITRIIHGEPADQPRRSIAERVFPVIEAAGVEAGLRRYRELKRARPDDYDFTPGQLLMVAQHYLEEGDTATAVILLEANVEEHPELPMPRFAIGEVYANAGDTIRAIESLEGALTRQPGIPQMMSALRDLGVGIDPALRFPVVSQPPDALDRLVGTYRVEPGITLTIKREGSWLMAQKSGEAEFRLLPQSQTLFLLHGSKIQFSFNLAPDGRPKSVTVAESGQQATFPKVE
jgi:CubicO group peptidase (beta-lactamase class C family)